jgi:hypothetical protein
MKEGLASDSFRIRMPLSAFLNILVVNEIGGKENGKRFLCSSSFEDFFLED